MKLTRNWRISALAPLLAISVVSPLYAKKPAVKEKEVIFRNGDVELHGTLLIPLNPGPVPAVVFLHGSGPHPRAGFRPYAEEFAQLGVASLSFDKRGSGDSGGSWMTASIHDLAGDAVAALDHLKSRKEIDSDRIGFWGVSQAGWVAPVAAAGRKDIAFMILVSGGGASPRMSEIFSYGNEFDKAGLSGSERARALNVLNRYFDYLGTGEGRSDLLSDLQGIRGTTLAPLAEELDRILPSEENRINWSWVASYDPALHLERLGMPILLLFGERDQAHPTELAVERWRQHTSANGNTTIVVFPGAGHGIRMTEGHTGEGRAPFAQGYLEVQLGWLWLHVISREN